MHSFIVFRLYGPLAAWGDIAVGEQRPTTSHPSKSAVLGLVAAALGIRNDDDPQHAALANGYGFAVRVDAVGIPLRDFHTSQHASSTARFHHLQTRRDELADRLNLDTGLSARDYRTDALYSVCLHDRRTPRAPTPQVIVAALQRPSFALYLGRRSCPLALPLAAKVIEAEDLPGALAIYDEAEASELWRRVAAQLHATLQADAALYWEDGIPPGELPATATTQRYDQPGSRARRQFMPRNEHHRMGGRD